MATSDHDDALPTLVGAGVTLRELRSSDSVILFSLLTEDQVVKFISPPPSSPDGFEKFINWSIAERKVGRHFSFGVVPDGLTEPVGVFQLRVIDRASNVAKWGFVLALSILGDGNLSGSRTADSGICVRDAGRATARGACGRS